MGRYPGDSRAFETGWNKPHGLLSFELHVHNFGNPVHVIVKKKEKDKRKILFSLSLTVKLPNEEGRFPVHVFCLHIDTDTHIWLTVCEEQRRAAQTSASGAVYDESNRHGGLCVPRGVLTFVSHPPAHHKAHRQIQMLWDCYLHHAVKPELLYGSMETENKT